jgi:hypothetical protein
MTTATKNQTNANVPALGATTNPMIGDSRAIPPHLPRPRGTPEQLAEGVLPPPPQQLSEGVLPPPQQLKQVYYYDPKEATDENGKLQIPSVVYDQNGTPIDLQALQGAQIYLEPPLQQMAVQSLPKWGESTSQDQSIIESTVAVMALLVGALSV